MQIVAESPRFFTVAPDERVLANFRASGPAVACEIEYDCMMNSNTNFVVQVRCCTLRRCASRSFVT